MRRDTTIIAALLAVGLLAGFTSVPKPRAALRVAVGTCPVTGPCSLVATWALPVGWRATDSLGVVWTQSTPAIATLGTRYARGTTDTQPVARTVEAQPYGGQVCLTTYRVGTAVTARVCAPWSAPAVPVPDPSPASGVTVAPASVTLAPGGVVNFTATAS